MTIFKAFLKVLNKCKGTVILYTVILVFFGAFNFQTSDNNLTFEETKPDLLIVNEDESVGITKGLVNYLTEHSNIVDIEEEEEARNDALFYRDVSYIVYIPKNFHQDFMNQKNPEIQIKSTGDYHSSYAQMMLEKYLKVASVYVKSGYQEEELTKKVEEVLKIEGEVEMTSKLDSTNLSKASFYFNFLNYSMLAGCIFVICLILSSFKQENINKRTVISSMNYKKINRILLLGNLLFAFFLWLIYILISFFLVGKVMFTSWGLLLIINSLLFTICAVMIAFFISNITTNKTAINGIINVVALGSSFLCGAFVPMEWLPDSVLKIAHILPSYWYIKSNELIKSLEVINLKTLQPIIINSVILLLFIFIFIVLSTILSKRKRRS